MFSKVFNGDLPIQGTDVAGSWDSLYNFLFWLSVFFFILVIGAMVYFAVKYKDKAGAKSKYITGSHFLEAIWVVVPTVLLMVIFVWGYSVYNKMTNPPTDAMEIRVIGKQWLWTFQYENGKTLINELYVPVNKPVKLIMTSEDVLHSFFIPNFRVKQDVVPGMYTSVWFEAKVTGKHQVYCAEYCGTSHSGMLANVIALDDAQWKVFQSGRKIGAQPIAGLTAEESAAHTQTAAAKLERGASDAGLSPLAAQGKQVFEAKGCMACHSTDGSAKVGPTVKGLFGHKAELADGSTATADENYIRESIERPAAKVVKGFQPVMPPFQGLINETELNALIAYIKSLK